MSQNEFYTKLLNQWQNEMDTLEARVFSILRASYPEGRTRQQLVFDVYGVQADVNINNDTRDRSIREAISRMRKRDIPIFSTSGAAGYRLDLSVNALGKLIVDLQGRRDHLDDQIRSLERTRLRLKHAEDEKLAETYPPREKAEQLRFME